MLVALIQELSAAYPPLIEAGALAAVSYRVKNNSNSGINNT